MDDDFDFDESLFQAVDQLESNYKSQVTPLPQEYSISL